MAIRTGIVFCTLILGSLVEFSLPVPEDDMDLSIFFQNADLDPTLEERIVGGSVAGNGAHPWMVAFTIGGTARTMHCGGSIISRRTVLTAAHCITPVRSGNSVNANVRVNVGTNRYASGGQSLSVNGMAIHPQYNANTIKNDIGTMFTSSNINFNNNVRAIAVSYDFVGGGVQARVAGGGQTSANAPASQQLLQIQVPTLDGNTCVRDVQRASASLNTRAPPVNPNIEICTFHSRGRGTCSGDSGSALVRTDRGQQIGVVSWGFPCALGAPDMYVRVGAFRSWIQQNTRN